MGFCIWIFHEIHWHKFNFNIANKDSDFNTVLDIYKVQPRTNP